MSIQEAPRKAISRLSLHRTRWGLLISAIFVVVVILAAVFAPLVSPYPPAAVDLLNVNSAPSAAHLLGTDALGRDTLSRMIYGARTALYGPIFVILLSTILGVILGLWAGWAGGIIDAVITRIFDIVLAFPALLLAILAVALFGKGLTAPIIAMSIAYTPYIGRLTRQLVSGEKNRQYVSAYQVQGFAPGWIATRAVMPNVLGVVGSQTTQNFGYVLVELAALSFLGLGIQAPAADWGNMINEGQSALVAGNFLPAMIPSLAVVLIVVAVNSIGGWLSDKLGDPFA
ncbi:dipeptide ABC transporter permease DppC [Glutamicibacter uratoxydans]|uniref:Dipeptide ABC transporter permease DppC n=1 Tax=Glutamicibacter uratoxydans TaxID=43667 RepID=A0A4Y4DM14_GLUUR|nr:ABC transporter permease [Glutamicibacter uratoxydans]GED05976.1 dipeptide ABC transporter permease DppC [Glutamicibacter uratoxydans]